MHSVEPGSRVTLLTGQLWQIDPSGALPAGQISHEALWRMDVGQVAVSNMRNMVVSQEAAHLSNPGTEPAEQVVQEDAPPGRTPTKVMEWIFALVLLCSWLANRGVLKKRKVMSTPVAEGASASGSVFNLPASKVDADLVRTRVGNRHGEIVDFIHRIAREGHVRDYAVEPDADGTVVVRAVHCRNNFDLIQRLEGGTQSRWSERAQWTKRCTHGRAFLLIYSIPCPRNRSRDRVQAKS
jgi:hypothetical protein